MSRLSKSDLSVVGVYADSGRLGQAIQLGNGKQYRLLDPDPAVLDEKMIAHSLSQLCRFTGHSSKFYSVAEHCIIVSEIIAEGSCPGYALEGLLHDASEAFVGDLSRPLKLLLREQGAMYDKVEELAQRAVAKRFGLEYPFPECVKVADNVALSTEKRDIMPKGGEKWFNMPEPRRARIEGLQPADAKRAWLRRFKELRRG